MFLELFATFIAGIGAAGLALLLNHATGRRLPKWVIPVAAGATMIAYTIWSEYTWAARTIADLPDGVEVVMEVGESRAWKPWTYVVPQVTRLSALDTATIRTRPDAEGTRLVELYLFARWQAPTRMPQLVHCENGARADVTDSALADPATADWIRLEQGDPLLERACNAAS